MVEAKKTKYQETENLLNEIKAEIAGDRWLEKTLDNAEYFLTRGGGTLIDLSARECVNRTLEIIHNIARANDYQSIKKRAEAILDK